MAWTELLDKFAKSPGDQVAVTEHTNSADGTQAEFVERMAANPFNGVVSGMDVTQDDVSYELDVASGVAYIEGYKATVAQSATFVGKAADDYYLYWDPTEANESDALKLKTTIPTQSELLMAYATWDGTDTITNFVDLRQWGIMPGQIVFSDLGAMSATTVLRVVMPYPVCIRAPYLIVDTDGSGAGPTLVDIHAGTAGSTASIWSAAGSRFSIAHDATDGAIVTGALPDQNFKMTALQVLEIIVDAVATDATGLHVVVPFTYY